MVIFYVERVKNGMNLWINVPKLWNKKVQTELVAQGYTLNDDGSVSKDDEFLLGK